MVATILALRNSELGSGFDENLFFVLVFFGDKLLDEFSTVVLDDQNNTSHGLWIIRCGKVPGHGIFPRCTHEGLVRVDASRDTK